MWGITDGWLRCAETKGTWLWSLSHGGVAVDAGTCAVLMSMKKVAALGYDHGCHAMWLVPP